MTPDELTEGLLEAGYYPVYKATNSEDDLDPILADVNEGLVVSAGGDGTLRAVATRLIDKENIALSVIPLGHANNIANFLGVTQSPLEIIAGLANPQKQPFEVGRIASPWGQDYFLEGAGLGFYADVLADYDPQEDTSILRSLKTTVETLANCEPYSTRMWLDGKDKSGEYLLVTALNANAFGPRLKLAPEAKPNDGRFDLVCIREGQRDGFLDYLASLAVNEFVEMPSVDVNRGRKFEMEWTGFTFHIDDQVRRGASKGGPHQPKPVEEAGARSESGAKSTIQIELAPEALEFWLPNQPEKSDSSEN